MANDNTNDLTSAQEKFLARVAADMAHNGQDPNTMTDADVADAMRARLNREADLIQSPEFRAALRASILEA